MNSFDYHPNRDISRSLAVSLMRCVNTELGKRAALLISQKRDNEYLALSVNPTAYSDSEALADDLLVTSLLAKADFLTTGIDTRKVAIQKFWEAEAQCADTNRRILRWSLSERKENAYVTDVMYRARSIISKVLGKIDYEEILNKAGWGPGVSSSAKKDCSAYNKFRVSPEATPDLIATYGIHVVNAVTPWASILAEAAVNEDGTSVPVSITRDRLIPVRGNVVAFVPKNAKTDRAIAVEPHVNAWIQKGAGALIRDRLLRIGINLNDQSVNQDLARKGSIDGSLCTIDLSSASDTISRELVEWLLPRDWFLLLDSMRSKNGYHEGKWFRYEKFSSMGNGFTFELESAIFYSFVKAVCEIGHHTGSISVYGDDIIAPNDSFASIKEVFDFIGFTVNEGKSFHTGRFRESCGKDYLNGVNVRPFYIRSVILQGDFAQVRMIANRIRYYASQRCGGDYSDSRFRRVWERLVLSTPRKECNPIPAGYGDGGFIMNFDEAANFITPVRNRNFVEGFLVSVCTNKPATRNMKEVRASVLHSIMTKSAESASMGVYPISGKTKLRRSSIVVRQWSELGPWI